MNTREFPVLTDGDRELIDRLAVGLGKDLLERFLTGTISGWAEAMQQPTAALNALGMNGERAERTIEHKQRTFERAVSEFGTSNAVDTNG
jgi:hypothetical protein